MARVNDLYKVHLLSLLAPLQLLGSSKIVSQKPNNTPNNVIYYTEINFVTGLSKVTVSLDLCANDLSSIRTSLIIPKLKYNKHT